MYGWKAIASEEIPANLIAWLLEVNHLTLALKYCGLAIKLHLISQEFTDLPSEEAQLLQAKKGLVRQICLADNERVYVYARTIVPENTYLQFKAALDHLGEQPIGFALLHDKDEVSRSPLEAGQIEPGSNLYQATQEQMKLAPDSFFARRSQFTMAGHPLLITEIFSPCVAEYVPTP